MRRKEGKKRNEEDGLERKELRWNGVAKASKESNRQRRISPQNRESACSAPASETATERRPALRAGKRAH